MRFQSLGGINEHGRNCFLLKGGNHQLLLDCGEGQKGEYPDFSIVDVAQVDALFLSHSHLDHTGSVKQLISLGFKGKVYLSKETYDCMSFHNFGAVFLKPQENYDLYPWLKVRTYRSGHCFGSLAYLLEFVDKRIVYSGDYLEDSVFYCDSLRDIKADLAILDGAYQNDELDMKSNKERVLSLLKGHAKMILPLPKNGRSMEVISLLDECGLPYQILCKDFFVENEETYLRKPVRVHPSMEANILLMDDPQLVKMENREIIQKHDSYTLVFTGTIDEGSYSEKLLKERKNTFFQRINVHQRIKDACQLASMNRFEQVILFHNEHTKEKTTLEF
jgi:Cft2 family RNA processing exonuclease